MTEGSTRPPTLNFVSRIRGARDTHALTPEEFRRRTAEAKAAYDKGTPNHGWTHQERFCGGMVRPYYDWDAKQSPAPDDLDFHKKFELLNFKEVIKKIHPDKAADVRYAQRHGDLEGGGYKFSYRAFVPGIAMNVTDIPVHVRSVLHLGPKETHEKLDLSVYKEREQLLGVVYGTKDTDRIKRYLLPLDEGVDPCEYLAQYVADDAVLFRPAVSSGTTTTSATSKGKRKGKGRAIREASEGAVVGGSGREGGEVGDEETVFTADDEDAKEALSSATTFCCDKYHLHEELTSLTVYRRQKYIRLPTKQKWCWVSRKIHKSNNPYITISEAGARFNCYDEVCKAKGPAPAVPLSELPKPLRDFFTRMFYEHVEQELMSLAKDECKRNITTNFPEEDGMDTSPFDNMLTTIATHQVCRKCKSDRMQFEHTLNGWYLRCIDCTIPWPSNPIVLPERDFPKLFAVLSQLNVSITVNNTTVNNNYLTTAEEPFVGSYDADGLVVFPEDDARNASFLRALQGTDASLSGFVYREFRDTFHCCKSGSKGTEGMWYQFRNHRWMPKSELMLRKLLGDEPFLSYFYRASHFYERECVQTEDTKRKARHIKRVLEQLGDGSRRKRILDDAIVQFHEYRPDFLEELDMGNKLVFTNGVYDFDTFVFRDGMPEDLLSIALKVPYSVADEMTADYAFVMEFMTAIQPDQASRDYLLTVLSLCLTTDTTMQHFWIFTGAGANGKSKLMNFLMEALGDHYGTAPAALLTRRREDANQANESLSALEKVRVAVFSEGSAAEILQVNTIKLFTGEDWITTRGLHEKQRRWKPKFKCSLNCNEIPKLDDNSWPAWRRIKVIHFPTLFVDNPQRPHERQKDPAIGEKLARCTAVFISILVQYYRRFKKEGLIEPPAVTEATQKYQTENDIFADFQEECLMDEQGASLEWNEGLNAFRAWAKSSRKTVPEKKSAIKALFELKLGKIYHNTFRGAKLYGWRHVRLADQ